jgi:hypothetical protein
MRLKILLTTVGLVSLGAGAVIGHAATGTPEIDRANATLQMSGSMKSTSCVGEDGVGYTTWHGSYNGGESQVTPDSTDYTLTGKVSITGIKWTISGLTGRGILTATIALTDTSGNATYKGKLTLVTQGAPAAGTTVPGRGWISAAFLPADENVSPGDDNLIANVEFSLSPSSAYAQFGDLAGTGSLGFPDYSAVTNVAPKAADGTC